eukprot:6211199-Pleurochrysis_carterae.AAC.7
MRGRDDTWCLRLPPKMRAQNAATACDRQRQVKDAPANVHRSELLKFGRERPTRFMSMFAADARTLFEV